MDERSRDPRRTYRPDQTYHLAMRYGLERVHQFLRVLRPEQPSRAWDVLQTKLFAGKRNYVSGNGLEVFPLP